MKRFFQDYGLYAAWVVALVATLGSLYFSEVAGFLPCKLCWYQRILMYPLVILLGIAAYRHDHKITSYTLPLSILGFSVALFHYLEEKTTWVDRFAAPTCSVGIPCDTPWINWLGFITIPFLSLTAFTLLTILFIGVARAAPKTA